MKIKIPPIIKNPIIIFEIVNGIRCKVIKYSNGRIEITPNL